MPAWFAASVNFWKLSVISCAGTAGSICEDAAGIVTEKLKSVFFVKLARISALAALNVLCSERYSANGGVAMHDMNVPPWIEWLRRHGPPHACTVLPAYRKRIELMGRTES